MIAPRLRGILVPLDGSELAEEALSVGAARARLTGATLHLVSVHEPQPRAAMPPDYALPVADIESGFREERTQYLESVASVARTSLGRPVVTEVLAGGVASSLCEYVESHEVDLVVMTTHGRGGLSRLWLGSVADRMLRRLAVPVLLLRPTDAPRLPELRHLLVALDGEIEEPVLEAIELLGGGGVQLHVTLTRVVEPTVPVLSSLAARPAHLPPDYTFRRELDARNYLARLGSRLAGRGWIVASQVLVGRGVADHVLELAAAIRAECIVVGTHRARGLERLLLGSVADKVVRGAKVPVLVVPVGRRGQAEEAGELTGAVAQPR